jgi:hypothetical protein
MAVKLPKNAPNPLQKRVPHNGKVIGVSTKENFRRAVPKTYSYRYEVTGDAGPAGDPLVREGAAIIESRYRGRGATWNMARSVTEPQTYLVRGGYIHPLEENPMAYPPRRVVSPEATAAQGRTPGFPTPTAANKVVRPRAVAVPAPTPAPERPAAPPPVTTRVDSPAPIRRAARPTPANESAYKKTG